MCARHVVTKMNVQYLSENEQVQPIIPESDPQSDKDKYVCTPCSNQNECGSICLKTEQVEPIIPEV